MTNKTISTFEELKSKISDKTATVGVVGLGYVGIPLVTSFINAGFRTIGFDIDAQKVQRLSRGEMYIQHLSSDWLSPSIANNTFTPTADFSRLPQADVILICVPTPLGDAREPDLSYIESTAQAIAKELRSGQLVVLESTTYPGTTRDVVMPILNESGLRIGDYFLAYSPEREDPGNPNFAASNIPKVVGGIDPQSCELANQLYAAAVVSTVPVSSCEVAEACKILENTYRSVNIAMVNELKILFDRLGVNVWEVIEAASTKPFGFQAFYPGPGLGGHCIPIDPFYLSWLARRHDMSARFIELAGEVNASMPHYVVQRVAEALNASSKPIRGSRIGVLGVAYKRDIDDCRESPAYKIMELLMEQGAIVTYNDPHVPVMPKLRHYSLPQLESKTLSQEWLNSLDCTLIVTDHTAYDYEFVVSQSAVVVDSRNATDGVSVNRDRILRA